MNNFVSWQTALMTSWAQVWASIFSVIPQIIGAVLIFAIGLVISYWVRKLVADFLKVLKFDTFSKKLGIEGFFKKANFKIDLSEVVGLFAGWLVILVFFLTAVDILGLSVVSQVLINVVSYVPNIFAAALILGGGYFVAGLVETLVRGALVSVDHAASKTVGNLARWVTLIVSFFAAVNQLQIAQGLIAIFFQGLTYTIVLAVGLSVGLGAKDLVSKVLMDWYEKVKK